MGLVERAFADDARIAPKHVDLLTPAASVDGISSPSQGVTLEFHDRLDGLANAWREFEKEADGTAFQCFDWLANWQSHIGSLRGVKPAIVMGRDSSGRILFILPFAVEQRRGVRCLTWLGSQLCDYNAPLLAPSFSAHFARGEFSALWQDIVRRLRWDMKLRFDLIDLSKMPERLGDQANPFMELATQVNPSGAYAATLTADWDGFHAAKRSSSTRKTERRQLRQLGEQGEIRFSEGGTPADIAATLEVLFTQKSHSFARMGVEDIFARPGHRAFFLDVASANQAKDLVHVTRLHVGPVTASTSLGLTLRGHYYHMLTSYDDGDISRFGPGRAHLHELFRAFIARGFRIFDFTIGDEPYKRDWSDIVLTLHDHVAAVTLKGVAAQTAMAGFRKLKRFIKQTPVLWKGFSKARSFTARRLKR